MTWVLIAYSVEANALMITNQRFQTYEQCRDIREAANVERLINHFDGRPLTFPPHWSFRCVIERSSAPPVSTEISRDPA